MIGIYKITNLINQHSYIGKSNNIHRRWEQHKSPYEWGRQPNSILYQAFQKYGIDNFQFEIIEECVIEELSEKEQYWIDYFDTFHNGYNMTAGGEGNCYDSHPRHKLTKEDVIDIRTRYNNLERRKEVYELYKNCIGESGFGKIWKGESWKGIMDEVYTPENKFFHLHNTGNKGSSNGRSRLQEEDVRAIRTRRKNGENWRDVYQDYSHLLTEGSFKNVWSYQNWKDIVV